MVVNDLEIRRARKLLDAFCRSRGEGPGGVGGRLHCEGADNCLYLVEAAGRKRLRLCLEQDGWRLFWPRADRGWEAYPHLPGPAGLDRILTELAQAPLHVHWD